jgi:hypothetical protein
MRIHLTIILFIISFISFIKLDNKKLKLSIFILSAIFLIFISGLRGPGVDLDYTSYEYMFDDPYFIVEPTFHLISWIVHNFFHSNIIFLFLIYAFFGVGFKFIAIYELSKLWFLSLMIYFTNLYSLHELTQIRVGVASGIFLISLKYLEEDNFRKYIFCTLIAFLFHYSSLIMLFLWPFNKIIKKRILYFIIPISYFFSLIGANLFYNIPIPGIQEKLDLLLKAQDLGDDFTKPINIFNYYQILRICIFYFFLYYYELLKKRNKYFHILLTLYCFSLAVVALFSNFQVIGFRISQFLGVVEIILFPMIYYIFKEKLISRSLVILYSILHFVYFIFFTELIN